MNRRQIVTGMAAESDFTIAEVEQIVDRFLDVIAMSLSLDEEVLLSGFGKFVPVHRPATIAVNPKTRVQVEVPEHSKVQFKPSPLLKDRINGLPG